MNPCNRYFEFGLIGELVSPTKRERISLNVTILTILKIDVLLFMMNVVGQAMI